MLIRPVPMGGADAQIQELVTRVLRSVFQSDDQALQEAIMQKGLSESERGSKTALLVTAQTVKSIAPRFTAYDSAKAASIRPRIVTSDPQMVTAITNSVKVIAKVSNTNPKVIANAIKRYQQTRPIINSFIQPKSGPPGWLGKLIQWGHVFQAQYFQWLYKHNQAAADERAGWCKRAISNIGRCKRSGPNWKERQFTDMRGPLWGYKYAEPGLSLNVRPRGSTFFDPNYVDKGGKKMPRTGVGTAPERVLYEYIIWTTGRGRPEYDFRMDPFRSWKHDYKDNPTYTSKTLFSWPIVEHVFSKSRYLKTGDPRFKAFTTPQEVWRFDWWFMIARWLVWAAEIWRANDPKRDLVTRSVERKWTEHTHKWAVGFVFPQRLTERVLFGQNLEAKNGRAAARMDSNATTQFNTQRLLELVMENTPAPMDLEDFRSVLGSMCDWPEERTGPFAPSPRIPGFKTPKGMASMAYSAVAGWEIALEQKIQTAHAHSPIQKTVMNVAKSIITIMSAEIGGIATVYFNQLVAAGEGIVQDIISDVLNSQLWATVSTPVGEIVKIVEGEIQSNIGNVLGLYDDLRSQLVDNRFEGATRIANNIKGQLENTRTNFPWTADLYGDVIPLPDESEKIIKYFR